MTDTIKVNFALQAETVDRLEELCRLTYRGKSDLVDYLVAKEYKNLVDQIPAPETPTADIQQG